tara:strand:+ start:1709 stop:2059 length:351 start_codon:yes stop_codon:yes gene_type:complete
MSLVGYCQNDTNKVSCDTIYRNPISVTDTLFNLQNKINQLEQQNYLLKDGIIKFKEQTYKGQNNLLKGMILTTYGIVSLSINEHDFNLSGVMIVGGLILDVQGILDIHRAYKHLKH